MTHTQSLRLVLVGAIVVVVSGCSTADTSSDDTSRVFLDSRSFDVEVVRSPIERCDTAISVAAILVRDRIVAEEETLLKRRLRYKDWVARCNSVHDSKAAVWHVSITSRGLLPSFRCVAMLQRDGELSRQIAPNPDCGYLK